jgi:parallel beta-helix repeat protein
MKVLLGTWGVSFLLLSYLPLPVWGTTGTLMITTDTTLTEDHTGDIYVRADNVTLNCDNHTVTGRVLIGLFPGVLESRSGVTVKNCQALGFTLFRASRTTLWGNTAMGSDFGLFEGSSGTLTENTATGNGTGFAFDRSSGTLRGNTAMGNGGVGFESRFSGLGITLTENTATGNGLYGFVLDGFSNGTLKGNTATDNNDSGFLLHGVHQSMLAENTAEDNRGNGFLLEHSTGNILKENTACRNQDFDIFEDGSSTGNVFKENDVCTTSGI